MPTNWSSRKGKADNDNDSPARRPGTGRRSLKIDNCFYGVQRRAWSLRISTQLKAVSPG